MFSYHASHEQFSPRRLVELAHRAEVAGFDAVFASDHINPWTRAQGQSGFMWAWLGAAMQATDRMPFAAITIPGGWRYHPAMTAQAIATLGEMFEGRLPWIALGSGEALNERVIGGTWPAKSERNKRLQTAAEIIRDLLAGHTVSRRDTIAVAEAKIWSRPAMATRLIGAALSVETATWLSTWADGLLTTATNLDAAKNIVRAFQANGNDKPTYAKVDLSWAATEEQALAQAHQQWRVHALAREKLSTLSSPAEFESASEAVQPDDMRTAVLVSSDLDRHIEWLRERQALGFAMLDLHNVGRNQEEFIEVFAAHVLPKLRRL
jgi:probable non-F420 flavinoid oxidoreductase